MHCKPAYLMPVPSQDQIGRVAAGRASSVKWGDEGGGLLISPDGAAPRQIVDVSASDISPCTIKSRRSFFFWHWLTGWSWKKGRKTVACVCVLLFPVLAIALVRS